MPRSALSENQLSGTIPSSLGNVTGLGVLCVLPAYLFCMCWTLSPPPDLFFRLLEASGLCGTDPIPFNNHVPSDGTLPPCPQPPHPSPPPSPSPPPPFPPGATLPFTCCTGQASCGGANNDPVTCAALGDFWHATNGSGWGQNGGWIAATAGTPTDYATFYGLQFDSSGVLTYLCVRGWMLRCAAFAER